MADFERLKDHPEATSVNISAHREARMYARKFKAGLRPTWAMLDSYKWRQRLKSNGYRYGARVRE